MTEAGLRIALHLTARITLVFFLCAFTGNAFRALWPARFSLWLSRNRDWFLVAMAASHTFHLAAIIAFFQVVGWSKLHLVTVLGGGSVYLLIYALAAAAIRRLRRDGHGFLAGSPRLEAAALYLIWLIFALAFIPRIVSGWPVYSILAVTALTALAIRIACLVRHKRSLAAAA
jgi:methionine sulfoxide reductase heme-binding subunit